MKFLCSNEKFVESDDLFDSVNKAIEDIKNNNNLKIGDIIKINQYEKFEFDVEKIEKNIIEKIQEIITIECYKTIFNKLGLNKYYDSYEFYVELNDRCCSGPSYWELEFAKKYVSKFWKLILKHKNLYKQTNYYLKFELINYDGKEIFKLIK